MDFECLVPFIGGGLEDSVVVHNGGLAEGWCEVTLEEVGGTAYEELLPAPYPDSGPYSPYSSS